MRGQVPECYEDWRHNLYEEGFAVKLACLRHLRRHPQPRGDARPRQGARGTDPDPHRWVATGQPARGSLSASHGGGSWHGSPQSLIRHRYRPLRP